jgi:hypothetical protein
MNCTKATSWWPSQEKQIKLFLCSVKHRDMKVYGGVDLQLHAFFISEEYALTTLPLVKKHSSVNWTGGWADSGTNL